MTDLNRNLPTAPAGAELGHGPSSGPVQPVPGIQEADAKGSSNQNPIDQQDMEVHHHPQVDKKNVKEYLLEGLMIFLAVTLGFIAENIREHITEHERARIYAASMIRDLEQDSAQLRVFRQYMQTATANVDTLLQMLSQHDPKDIPPARLYWFGLFGGAHQSFTPNDATFQQMKASGTLRYFTGSNLALHVARYDQLCRNLAREQEIDQSLYAEVRKCRSLIFAFTYNDQCNKIFQANRKAFSQARIDSFLASSPKLLSTDQIVFNQYVELIRARYMGNYVLRADTLMAHASQLITELKQTYPLQEE